MECVLGGRVVRAQGLAYGFNSFVCLFPVRLVVDYVNGCARVRVARYRVFFRKGMDGVDVGELESGNLNSGVGAEGFGIVEKGAVGGRFCVSTCGRGQCWPSSR